MLSPREELLTLLRTLNLSAMGKPWKQRHCVQPRKD